MKRNAFDSPPVAPFLQIRGKLILSEAIENPVFRYSALAGHLEQLGGERPLAERQEQAGKRAYTSGHADAIVRTCRVFVLVLP